MQDFPKEAQIICEKPVFILFFPGLKPKNAMFLFAHEFSGWIYKQGF